jgi:hypothetical protein
MLDHLHRSIGTGQATRNVWALAVFSILTATVRSFAWIK